MLLFRKFSADFSENYRTKPLSLTSGAEEILLRYRFPGNIRQLKNLVEQMSVLELDRQIESETILGYLPRDESRLPALVDKNGGADDFTERDILYKVLFDMKNDMTDMKKLILQLLQGNANSNELLQEHGNLFEDMTDLPPRAPSVIPNDGPKPLLIEEHNRHQGEESVIVEDISHELEDESLSLEKKEKEMIVKALRKNNNKRKYAAEDLGISERTLYRKIKQYEIENG